MQLKTQVHGVSKTRQHYRANIEYLDCYDDVTQTNTCIIFINVISTVWIVVPQIEYIHQ